MASNLYNFDENISEEEIKEKYVKITNHSSCSILTDNEDFNGIELYGMTKSGMNDMAFYDCGEGEKTFDGKKFSPKIPEIRIFRDAYDCFYQTTEESCYNIASKFITNEVIACWNKVNKSDSIKDREKCKGYKVSEYKTEFKKMYKDYLKYNDKIEETWNCVGKSGKKIRIYMNTYTSQFIIN